MGIIFLETPHITQNDYHASMGTWGTWMVADVEHLNHWLRQQGFRRSLQIMRDPGGQTLRVDFLRAHVKMIRCADVGNLRRLLQPWAVGAWEWAGEDVVMLAAYNLQEYGFMPSHITSLRDDGLCLTIAPYHRVVSPHNEASAHFLRAFQTPAEQ